MNNFVISPIEEKDTMDVLEINNLSFSPPWSLKALENELKNKFAKYIVLKKENKVIGYAGIWLIIDEAHITNIAMHPDYRGIGGGNLLMEGVIAICREYKIPSITLEVRENNTSARGLYKKFGFVQEGIRKNYYENNIDAIVMWKRDVLSN
ncbi:ribosomal protein S18-alanine N-acetyltransferase [Clostridium ganghwense]|uniref:[Ribosomal protein bS18]-alanine N-acetyltransferase n=1 Tax=Clostridium ganghwense TaxID=312089 RepID=A0ABT4CL63_9CLOT|nr:ribosomal protein S18-alanine N-acetyltransferase [Clostridium ganghwense]MCY6369790.1 ribosomal protein S18-alanine N-acetyltransferase [Clostridium ganghwense]